MKDSLLKYSSLGLISQSIVSIILLFVITLDYISEDELIPVDWKFTIILTMFGFMLTSFAAHIKNSFATKQDKKCHYCNRGKLEANSYVCKLCGKPQ